MRLSATIEVPGQVAAFKVGEPPPAEGIAICHDGYDGRPGTLYVNGVKAGLLIRYPDVQGETVFEMGNPEPIDYITVSTTLHVYLALPTPTDEEFEATFAGFPDDPRLAR